MGTELQTKETGFDRFIEMALNKEVPVETLERLLAMQKEIMAANAKAQYDDALSAFQKECPIIHKGRAVMNKSGGVRYNYAPMDSIISQVREPLAKHGFSYDVDTRIAENGWIEAIVTATHIGGHSKTKVFSVPIDKDAFMNEQQKVAAARTYALRYCFTGIFGIMTGDEDDDAITAGKAEPTTTVSKSVTEKQVREVFSQPLPAIPENWPANTIIGFVESIEEKQTAKSIEEQKTKPAAISKFRYKIVVLGQAYYTFSSTLKADAERAQASGCAIAISPKESKWGTDIIALKVYDKEPVKPSNAKNVIELYQGELEPGSNG